MYSISFISLLFCHTFVVWSFGPEYWRLKCARFYETLLQLVLCFFSLRVLYSLSLNRVWNETNSLSASPLVDEKIKRRLSCPCFNNVESHEAPFITFFNGFSILFPPTLGQNNTNFFSLSVPWGDVRCCSSRRRPHTVLHTAWGKEKRRTKVCDTSALTAKVFLLLPVGIAMKILSLYVRNKRPQFQNFLFFKTHFSSFVTFFGNGWTLPRKKR